MPHMWAWENTCKFPKVSSGFFLQIPFLSQRLRNLKLLNMDSFCTLARNTRDNAGNWEKGPLEPVSQTLRGIRPSASLPFGRFGKSNTI